MTTTGVYFAQWEFSNSYSYSLTSWYFLISVKGTSDPTPSPNQCAQYMSFVIVPDLI